MPDTRKCLGPPRCRYTSQEGVKQHEPGCPMLLPPPVVARDPYRLEHPLAAVTGGDPMATEHGGGVHDVVKLFEANRNTPERDAELDKLHGIPAAIGVDEPRTFRPGEYMGIPRNGTPLPLVAGVMACTREEAQEALGRIGIAPMTVVPTRTRPDDQPLPTDDGGPAMQDLVIADIDARKQVGIERYGQTLKAWDGRDNLQDIYEELLDAAIYVRKEIYKRDGK